MNKKKLSVVMAGAMLASSVSPVLAATESKVDQNELGSLVVSVYDKLTSKLYSDTSSASAIEKLGEDVNGADKNTSVYKVYAENVEVPGTAGLDLTTEKGKADLKVALQERFKTLTAGQKVEIRTFGCYEVEGYTIGKKQVQNKYEKTSFDDGDVLKNSIVNALWNDTDATDNGSNENTELLSAVGDVTVSKDTSAVIKFKANVNDSNKADDLDLKAWADKEGYTYTHNANGQDQLTISVGQKKLDFSRVIMKDGSVKKITTAFPAANDRASIYGFAYKKDYEKNATETVEEKIEVTGKENNLKTDDLYDGLMLTTEGHDLLNIVKEARKKEKTAKYKVDFKSIDGTDIPEKADYATLDLFNGEYGFTITIKDAFGKTTVYTVKGAKKATETLAGWLNSELAKVDILAGANRYETAVQIAKEYAGMPVFKDGETNDIVLVNGRALVDGLSASPLAAQLTKSTSKATPILLTEADALPKETKAYIKELLANKSANDLANGEEVTVHLVGGRSVLSTAVENELKDMGLKIKRYNGDNREETSLKVADKIIALQEDQKNTVTSERFVVGGEGEADAMSIAPVASTLRGANNDDVTPIIVSKKGGLTDEALEAVAGKLVTVIGGEGVVSKADYEALEENVGVNGTVRRISGENRQGTNAAIIKAYYTDTNSGVVNGINKVESVVVAKDGRGSENNIELVDALTAANLAAQKNAPIVLAKSSLSTEQMDAINLRGQSAKSLYQVGIGVERPVVETLAKALGLSNLK